MSKYDEALNVIWSDFCKNHNLPNGKCDIPIMSLQRDVLYIMLACIPALQEAILKANAFDVIMKNAEVTDTYINCVERSFVGLNIDLFIDDTSDNFNLIKQVLEVREYEKEHS